MSRTLASLFAAIAISAASVAPAMADTSSPKFSVRVSYADLDLTRTEGVKTLTVRLDRAIDKACGAANRRMPLKQVRVVKQCRVDAMDQAVASIDAPLLTALYEGGAGSQFAGL